MIIMGKEAFNQWLHKYYGNNANGNYYNWVDWDLTEGANDINIKLDASSIYKFYLKNDNGAWKIKVEKES